MRAPTLQPIQRDELDQEPPGSRRGGIVKPSRQTRAVRAGVASDPVHGAVMPPLYLSSTFAFEGFDQPRSYDYTRSGNPTRDQLGAAIADLEGGVGGVVVPSGMAAVDVATHLLEPGDLLLAPHDCYGGTHRLLSARARRRAFDVVFIDQTDSEALGAALALGPRMVWIETPSNPLLRIVDLATVPERAHEMGVLVVVDNTFLSPALQRPIEWGADIVVHSTTKYLNGHSDVVGGAVVAADATVHETLAWWANCIGACGAPFDAYLTLRGLRTLGARMRIHCENALRLARLLEGHDAVKSVHYPGLESHPEHALATHQQVGYGGMLSFDLVGGVEEAAAFLGRLRYFTLAESLGGVESLICHPATMTHAAMPEEARCAAGIGDGLLRISVGVEDVRDLESDLLDALDRSD